MKERRNFICFVESCFLRNQHWVLFNFQFTKDREINVYTRRGDGVVVREEPSQLVWKNSRNNGTDRGNQEGCFSKHWDKLGRKPRIRRHTPPHAGGTIQGSPRSIRRQGRGREMWARAVIVISAERTG